MALPATDDFNRGDSETLGPNWTISPTGSVDWTVLSNEASAEGTIGGRCGALWNQDWFSANQYCQVTVKALNGSVGNAVFVTARHGPGTTATYDTYAFGGVYSGSSETFLSKTRKVIDGAFTDLASAETPIAVDDLIRIEVRGVWMVGLVNGIQRVSPAADGALASGAVGLLAVSSADDVNRVDDWEGGAIGSDLEPKGWHSVYPTVVATGSR